MAFSDGALDEALKGAVGGFVGGAVDGAVGGVHSGALDGVVGDIGGATGGAHDWADDGAVGEALDGTSTLTKNQRKKLNQKIRKAAQKAEAQEGGASFDGSDRVEYDMTKQRVRESVSNEQLKTALLAVVEDTHSVDAAGNMTPEAAEQQLLVAQMLKIHMQQEEVQRQRRAPRQQQQPSPFLVPQPPLPQGMKEEDMSPEEADARKKYRRSKNNISAKKCRDSRKLIAQSNEITVKVLEKKISNDRKEMEKTQRLLDNMRFQLISGLMKQQNQRGADQHAHNG